MMRGNEIERMAMNERRLGRFIRMLLPPVILGFSLAKRDDAVHFDAKPNKNQKSLTKVFGSVRFVEIYCRYSRFDF